MLLLQYPKCEPFKKEEKCRGTHTFEDASYNFIGPANVRLGLWVENPRSNLRAILPTEILDQWKNPDFDVK